MPTYEYICRGCGHEFEAFQSMTDGPKRKCPECAKNALERKIGTGAAVIFKGSGFYQTDYRSEAYKKSAEAEKKPPGDGKDSATKSETPKTDSTNPAAAKPAEPAKSEPAPPKRSKRAKS